MSDQRMEISHSPKDRDHGQSLLTLSSSQLLLQWNNQSRVLSKPKSDQVSFLLLTAQDEAKLSIPPWLPRPCRLWPLPTSLPLSLASCSSYTGLLHSSSVVPSVFFYLWALARAVPLMHPQPQPQSPSHRNLSQCSSLVFLGSSILHTQSLMFFSFTLPATIWTFIIYDSLVNDTLPPRP